MSIDKLIKDVEANGDWNKFKYGDWDEFKGATIRIMWSVNATMERMNSEVPPVVDEDDSPLGVIDDRVIQGLIYMLTVGLSANVELGLIFHHLVHAIVTLDGLDGLDDTLWRKSTDSMGRESVSLFPDDDVPVGERLEKYVRFRRQSEDDLDKIRSSPLLRPKNVAAARASDQAHYEPACWVILGVVSVASYIGFLISFAPQSFYNFILDRFPLQLYRGNALSFYWS